ncbi:MAG: type II secretion system protein [Kiritimatiellia bacterium]
MKPSSRSGFTLIELVLIVAIVAIITVLAIGKFADLRKDAARKINVANLKNIARTIHTEIARLDGETSRGMFAYAESLVDCAQGGGDPTGSEGTYQVQANWYNGQGGVVPGIYCGVKATAVVENADGATTGEIAAIADAHEGNVGLESLATATTSRGTTTPAKLCLYYLTETDVAALKEAGVSIVSRHNYSNAQASTLNWSSSKYYTQMGLHSTGGGPGHRPDLSACYPVVLTNGSAVAVLNPAACATIYRDLGLDYASTYNVSGLDANDPSTYYNKGICAKLYVFGLGRDCEATTRFFESAPRCPTLDKTHYRNYLLVFKQNTGLGNAGSGVTFVGVIDPEGHTVKSAQYDADWAS